MQAFFDATGRLGRWMACLAMALLGLLVLLVSADVALRTAGFKPLAWTTDAAEYILLYATFLPLPHLVRSKGHVFVEFLRAPMPPALQRRVEQAVYAVCLGLSAWLAWLAAGHLLEALRNGTYDPRAFDLPAWINYLAMAAGLGLAVPEWLRFLLGHDSLYAIDPAAREGY